MATFNLIRTTLRMLPLLAVLGASRNALATTMYSAPLPVINLNNAADGSRSNIAPVESNFSGSSVHSGRQLQLVVRRDFGNVQCFDLYRLGSGEPSFIGSHGSRRYASRERV